MIKCNCPVQDKAPEKIIYSGLVLHEEKPFACKQAHAKRRQPGAVQRGGCRAGAQQDALLPASLPPRSSSCSHREQLRCAAKDLSFLGEKQELFTPWAHLKPVPTCSPMGMSELRERG